MLNKIVKYIRIANDMSTKEVAELMGVRCSFVSDLENGTRNITMSSLKKLAIAYNISVSQILFFDEQQEQNNMNYRQTLIMILKYLEYECNNNLEQKFDILAKPCNEAFIVSKDKKEEFLSETIDLKVTEKIRENAETFEKNNLVDRGPVLKK